MVDSRKRQSTLSQSFGFAFRGVSDAFVSERNFRVQVLYGVLVALLMLALQPPLALALLSLLTVVLLMAAELANSALERAVDLACAEQHPVAAEAKDMAAGAVMLLSFCSALVVLWTLAGELRPDTLLGLGAVFLAIFMRGRPSAS